MFGREREMAEAVLEAERGGVYVTFGVAAPDGSRVEVRVADGRRRRRRRRSFHYGMDVGDDSGEEVEERGGNYTVGRGGHVRGSFGREREGGGLGF
jgi:hypothetical protein